LLVKVLHVVDFRVQDVFATLITHAACCNRPAERCARNCQREVLRSLQPCRIVDQIVWERTVHITKLF
jgi:hypothetical protein